MDNLFFIGMGLFFALMLAVIFIMVRNRLRGRDELDGFFPMKPKKRSLPAPGRKIAPSDKSKEDG